MEGAKRIQMLTNEIMSEIRKHLETNEGYVYNGDYYYLKDSKLYADGERGDKIVTMECILHEEVEDLNNINPLSFRGFVILKLIKEGMSYDQAVNFASMPIFSGVKN